MNIIVPLTKLQYLNSNEFNYPVSLIEIKGYPLIKYAIDNLNSISGENNFVFILSKDDCVKFRLDNLIKVLVPSAKVVILDSKTKGAPCSILMAIKEISKNNKTLIVNSDQYFNLDFNKCINDLIDSKADAGIVSFDAIHPRWSFVSLDSSRKIVLQSSEKNPISRNAIAGIYYFKEFNTFFNSTIKAIEMEDYLNDQLYTSSILNQVILDNKIISNISIDSKKYFSFYSIDRINEFKKIIKR